MPTKRLGIGTIQQNQNNKYITINEGFNILESVGLGFIGGVISSPTDATSDGFVYIVADNASGSLSSRQGNLAYNLGGVLVFYPPTEGMVFRSRDNTKRYYRNATQWVESDAATGSGGNTNQQITEDTQTFNLTVAGNSKTNFELSVANATILNIDASEDCRVRAYKDTSTRSNDAVVGTDFVNGANTIDYGLLFFGNNTIFKQINIQSSETDEIPMVVFNNSASQQTITLEIKYRVEYSDTHPADVSSPF